MVQEELSAWVTTEMWVNDLENKNSCPTYNFHVKFFQNPRIPTPSISHLFSLNPSRLSPPIPGECPKCRVDLLQPSLSFVLNYQSAHQILIIKHTLPSYFPLTLSYFTRFWKGVRLYPLISPFSPKTLVDWNIIKRCPLSEYVPAWVSLCIWKQCFCCLNVKYYHGFAFIFKEI